MAKINQKPQDVSCEGNSLAFALRQMIGQFSFIEIVQVQNVNSITKSDGSTLKTLDVIPLLHGVTTDNEIIDNEPIYGVPYLRLQRGSSAVIMDPEVGDIGLIAVCDRDVSNILNSGKAAAPGKPNQLHNASNAVYLTGIASLNTEPTQYVRFLSDGIDIVSPLVVSVEAPSITMTADNNISLNAPTITLNGAVNQGEGSNGGAATFANGATTPNDFVAGDISLKLHRTSEVQSGTGTSGVPVV